MFLKIHDPDKPGDYLVLSKNDFDPAKHVLFDEPLPSVAEEKPEPKVEAPTRKGRKG